VAVPERLIWFKFVTVADVTEGFKEIVTVLDIEEVYVIPLMVCLA
jgi:hypothetical protein